MKKIPARVLVACAFCAACLVLSGAIRLAAPEIKFISQLAAWLGIAGVAVETFGWGAREGYLIKGRSLGVQLEHVLRCAAMTGIMTLVAVLAAGSIMQVIFDAFFRK